MSGAALIEIRGVLRGDNDGPIPEGITLVTALAEHYLIVLVGEDAVDDERWLKVNGMVAHAQILIGEMQLALRQARGRLGMDIRFLVSPSPATIAASMHAGTPSLLFAHPRFARPEFRDDVETPKREWDAIVTELDAQLMAGTKVRRVE